MNNQAPGLQKELFSPRGSLICVWLEALSCALSPQGLRFLWHHSQGVMATTRFPFLCTGEHTSSWTGRGGHLEGRREEPGCSYTAEKTSRKPPGRSQTVLSQCTAAGSAGWALAAPAPERAVTCWIWWSGWSGWTARTWCSGSGKTLSWEGFARWNGVGSSWRTRLPCWRPRGASGPEGLSSCHWGPLWADDRWNPWPGWTHWARAEKQKRLLEWNIPAQLCRLINSSHPQKVLRGIQLLPLSLSSSNLPSCNQQCLPKEKETQLLQEPVRGRGWISGKCLHVHSCSVDPSSRGAWIPVFPVADPGSQSSQVPPAYRHLHTRAHTHTRDLSQPPDSTISPAAGWTSLVPLVTRSSCGLVLVLKRHTGTSQASRSLRSISTSSHTLGHTLASDAAPQTHTGSWTYVLLQVLALSSPTSSSHLILQTHTTMTNSDCIPSKTLSSPSALHPMKPPLLESSLRVTRRGRVLTPDPWISSDSLS